MTLRDLSERAEEALAQRIRVRVDLEHSVAATPPRPCFGASAINETVKVTLMLASTNIRTFVMMSRNGTMLSSPASSSGAISFGWESRRIFERCAAVSLLVGGVVTPPAVATPPPTDTYGLFPGSGILVPARPRGTLSGSLEVDQA
jgi:hypothetical protein